MADYAAMKRDLLAECEDDHVSLSTVIGYVRDEMPAASESQVHTETLALIADLLQSGQVQAGFPDSNGRDFHPWPFSSSVIIDEIKTLWSPSVSPKPGEIVWFTATANAAARV